MMHLTPYTNVGSYEPLYSQRYLRNVGVEVVESWLECQQRDDRQIELNFDKEHETPIKLLYKLTLQLTTQSKDKRLSSLRHMSSSLSTLTK